MIMEKNRARLFFPKSTIEQLAKQLSAQLRRPVTDATGLTDKYDISLFWVDDVLGGTPAGSVANPTASPAQDGEIGPTLEKALQEQLGLRLELKRGPVDVMVVDHFEKSPSGN